MATPLPKNIFNLIGGIGSYDIVRAGFEWERNNIASRAHRSNVELIQSFKMTHGQAQYAIPQFLRPELEFYAQSEYLKREEISFDREEWGGGLGMSYFLKRYNVQLSAEYNFHKVCIAHGGNGIECN